MLKLFIGNKAYSSWSMRGWLAVKQSGLPFEEATVPLFDADWDQRRQGDEFAAGGGKVPIFWPEDEQARAMARSMAAEMHSGFANLRRELPMNVRKQFPARQLSAETVQEIGRVLSTWAHARARFGGTGKFLFDRYSAADIMFAPVATRFVTYSVPLPGFAATYVEALYTHPHVRQWIEDAQNEDWTIEKYEQEVAA